MNTINIKSNLYNYSVYFIENFLCELQKFGENSVYIIDKNVYQLYKKSFSTIDFSKIYLMDAVEHRKNMDTVMEIVNFLKFLEVKKIGKLFVLVVV